MNRINAQTRRFATAAAVGALALANNAHAAIDVTGVVSEINDTIAPTSQGGPVRRKNQSVLDKAPPPPSRKMPLR